MAIPPLAQQVKIVAVTTSIDEKLKAVTTKLAALKNKKKALMQDLLTGKVRVKVD